MSAVPLRIVVGFSPGSASDDIAQLMAPPLSKALQRPVNIERIPGHNGAHGAMAVARAPADGTTLFVATLGTHALAPHLPRPLNNLLYDPQRDFEPVSLLTQSPMLLACHTALPIRNLPEFVAYARENPGVMAYGTSAIGGAPHLAAELFQAVTGIQLQHARYNETQQLYADLEAGRIALSFNNIMSMLPRCGTRKLRALGITSLKRSPAALHIPTLAESGVQGCEVSNWVGLVAPPGTPAAIVAAISQAAATVINSSELSSKLIPAGISPVGSSPLAFERFMASELTRWKPVVGRFAAS